nr:MAG TPA: hypothetical protein [Caudoviricetes sp.]
MDGIASLNPINFIKTEQEFSHSLVSSCIHGHILAHY